ncbi:hypothetical protein AB0L62_33275 [Nocardia asteroides]|uniref:hypothetical protein n=1 Tax=Nocardia asteroides TaxID=1824 RepID=UPI003414B775
MAFRKRARPPVDLSSEAPADVAKTEEHALHISGPGFSGKFNSSGSPGVGRALALLVLVGAASAPGYLVAQLVDRYALHPGVAIPLVIGVALTVFVSGLWLVCATPAPQPVLDEAAVPARPRGRGRWRGRR